MKKQMDTHAYIHTYVHTYIHVHIYTCIRACIYTYIIFAYMHANTHTRPHTHMHTCMHTHIDAYAHTCTHKPYTPIPCPTRVVKTMEVSAQLTILGGPTETPPIFREPEAPKRLPLSVI